MHSPVMEQRLLLNDTGMAAVGVVFLLQKSELGQWRAILPQDQGRDSLLLGKNRRDLGASIAEAKGPFVSLVVL